jgi:hypothetical protein
MPNGAGRRVRGQFRILQSGSGIDRYGTIRN